MPFEAVTNLATVQAAEEERKRKQQQAALAQDAADLKRQAGEQRADEAGGPAALLTELTGGNRRAAVEGSVLDAANQDRFLNEQAHRRLGRQESALGDRAEGLAVPPPSAGERATQMLAPLGTFATEDPSARQQELRTDPRGRLGRLEAQRGQLTAPDVSRETSPIFSDAPRATGADDTGTMPYAGGLDALLGAAVPRAGIRKEFGGTADDRTLSFSDRPGPGLRPVTSRGGSQKDVGAPGGGLSAVGGRGSDTTAQAALLQGLDEMIGEAKRQPTTPQEVAAGLVKEEPAWDIKAAKLGPDGVRDALNQWVAEGGDPKVSLTLQRKYDALANDVDDGSGPDPQAFADRLRQGRPPAPGEAEARAKTGGTQLPVAQAEEQQATRAAQEPPPGGPGSTRSPALANAEGFFGGLGSAARRGTERLGTEGPATPESFPSTGAMARGVLPLAAAPFTAGMSIPAAAATSFGVGAGSELLGQLFNGEDLDPKAIGATGLLEGIGGAALPAIGRAAGRGFNAVRSLAKRGAADAIPGIYGPAFTEGAPTRVLGGLTEEAGAARPGMSTLERARQGSAEVGSVAPPEGAIPYFRENLPALRGSNLPMGGATDEPLDIEALIQDYLRSNRRALPPGAVPENTLPALRGGGFVMR